MKNLRIKLNRCQLINSFIFATSLIFFLFITWNKWGALIIDTFRDPWIAYKISQGQVLYRDIFYSYGFLPPYLISLLYKIFGVNIQCLIWTGIIITAISYVLIYRISRFFLNRAFSTLCALTFLSVFAFGFYRYNNIFNFILPYSLPSTFVAMFTLFALYFFLKFIRRPLNKHLWGWIISMHLAFLCRLDLSFFAWVVFVVLALTYIFKGKKHPYLIFYLAAPFLSGVLSYWLFLFVNRAFGGFKESIIDYFFTYTNKEYYISYLASGVNQAIVNFKIVVKSFFYQLTAVFSLFLWSAALSFIGALTKRRIPAYFMTGVAASCSAVQESPN